MVALEPTRYYLAATYSRHPEMRRYRDQLAKLPSPGIVTSRWIDQHDGEAPERSTTEAMTADPARFWKFGKVDLDDLGTADVIVSFTGGDGTGRGGRHTEHGYAIAIAELRAAMADAPMRLVVIGEREHVFHCHPDTEVYPDFASFLQHEREHPCSS